MTIFARYHCALNFSLSVIWLKIITAPSQSTNRNGSAEVLLEIREMRLTENASQAKFLAVFIKAPITDHLNSRTILLSVRHYALPSVLGVWNETADWIVLKQTICLAGARVKRIWFV